MPTAMAQLNAGVDRPGPRPEHGQRGGQCGQQPSITAIKNLARVPTLWQHCEMRSWRQSDGGTPSHARHATSENGISAPAGTASAFIEMPEQSMRSFQR